MRCEAALTNVGAPSCTLGKLPSKLPFAAEVTLKVVLAMDAEFVALAARGRCIGCCVSCRCYRGCRSAAGGSGGSCARGSTCCCRSSAAAAAGSSGRTLGAGPFRLRWSCCSASGDASGGGCCDGRRNCLRPPQPPVRLLALLQSRRAAVRGLPPAFGAMLSKPAPCATCAVRPARAACMAALGPRMSANLVMKLWGSPQRPRPAKG